MINHIIIIFLTIIIVQISFFLFLENFIYYILNLLFIFIEIGFLLILLNNEFLAFVFLIIYAGAIIILFIFVLMLIELKITKIAFNLHHINNLLFFMIFILFLIFKVLHVETPSLIFFVYDDSTFWYYIQSNVTSMRLIEYYLQYFNFNYFYDLESFSDLSYLSIVLYNDFFLETIILGLYILMCLVMVTLQLR